MSFTRRRKPPLGVPEVETREDTRQPAPNVNSIVTGLTISRFSRFDTDCHVCNAARGQACTTVQPRPRPLEVDGIPATHKARLVIACRNALEQR